MAIDGCAPDLSDAVIEPPTVEGLVRLDGKAYFPSGWINGSFSIAKRYNHFVMVIKGVYNGELTSCEYRLCDVRRSPILSEKRKTFSVSFHGNVNVFLKASVVQLKLLNAFVRPLLNGDFAQVSDEAPVLYESPSSSINGSGTTATSQLVLPFPASPLAASPVTRSSVKNLFSKKRSPPVDVAASSPRSEPASPPRAAASTLSTKSPWSADGVGASTTGRPSGYQTRMSTRRQSIDTTPSAGFSNLGNTCYMNAILQAVLGQKPFCQELYRVVTKYCRSIPNDSLLRLLAQLLQCKAGDVAVDKQKLLRSVKSKVALSASGFSDNSEHDAQEFQAMLLNRLADEVKSLNKDNSAEFDMPNPVLGNFAFTICHYLKCKQCNEVCSREEQFFDLPLDISLSPTVSQAAGGAAEQQPISLQALVGSFFVEETVNCNCALCKCSECTVQHRVTKLPRILVLHVKRYKFNEASCVSEKAENKIAIPTYLTLQDYCASDAVDCVDLTNSAKKIVNFSAADDLTGSRSQTLSSSSSSSSLISRRLFADEPSTSSRLTSDPMRPPRSKRRLFASSQKPVGCKLEEDDEEDDDSEYNKQLMEAIQQSLIDSNVKGIASDSLDSVDVAEHFNPSSTTTTTSSSKEDAVTELERNEKEGFLPRSFRLCAVVSHIGISSVTGHYVSDVYDWREKEWYCFNDSSVTKTTESFVQRKRQKSGYIFFYVDKKLLSESSSDVDSRCQEPPVVVATAASADE